MKKQIVSLLLAVVLVLPWLSAFPAHAEDTDILSETTIERVYDEVLTGDITNVQDVLDVALMQMETMGGQNSTATYSSRATDNNSSLQITQLVDSTENENGDVEGTIAVTGLLLVDENGRSVSADEYRKYRMNMNNREGDLSSYHIYATHTIYVKLRNNSTALGGSSSIELEKMKVTLIYGTSVGATKIRQVYVDQADLYDLDTIREEQAWIYSPAAGDYYFTPTKAREIGLGFTAVQGFAEIYYGNVKMTVGTVLQTDFLQNEIDNGTLIEGW